jgi:hypothetical protein
VSFKLANMNRIIDRWTEVLPKYSQIPEIYRSRSRNVCLYVYI